MPNGGRSEDPGHGSRPASGEEPRVVVRDRRRIDPQTGQVRPPVVDTESAAGEPPGRPGTDTESGKPVDDTPTDAPGTDDLRAQLDERTADLQRLTAEYANYRKRVDRDRESVLVAARATLAGELLSVLDDVERAAAHGDLTGAFKAVADKLVATLQRAGLAPFGQHGEPFDPSVHEAVQHDTSPDVPGPTVTAVLRRGYRLGDRVLRAALVGVTDHEPAPEPEPADGDHHGGSLDDTAEPVNGDAVDSDAVDSDGAAAH
ncbi:MAG TPA: nucleotide exchange factor GrpE [Pseudonocardiaceae bacterium]|jgi:molecular chaperone GrpE|nr:nucleotide exchange factor GrpE [Pseudonocardiaceae bacterium]